MAEEAKNHMIPRVGVGIMFIKDGKVLLGKRHETPEKADSELHGEGTWTVPGGKLDFHETLHDGALREAKEECNLQANKIKLVSVCNEIIPDKHFITVGFACDSFSGTPQVMEPDEITRWEWFPLTELPDPMFPPSKKMVDAYLDKNIYSKER